MPGDGIHGDAPALRNGGVAGRIGGDGGQRHAAAAYIGDVNGIQFITPTRGEGRGAGEYRVVGQAAGAQRVGGGGGAEAQGDG